MDGCRAAKISSFCVANLGNSLPITCDLRLESENFVSHIISPRINQRLLKFESCEFLSKVNREEVGKRSVGYKKTSGEYYVV